MQYGLQECDQAFQVTNENVLVIPLSGADFEFLFLTQGEMR